MDCFVHLSYPIQDNEVLLRGGRGGGVFLSLVSATFRTDISYPYKSGTTQRVVLAGNLPSPSPPLSLCEIKKCLPEVFSSFMLENKENKTLAEKIQ